MVLLGGALLGGEVVYIEVSLLGLEVAEVVGGVVTGVEVVTPDGGGADERALEGDCCGGTKSVAVDVEETDMVNGLKVLGKWE